MDIQSVAASVVVIAIVLATAWHFGAGIPVECQGPKEVPIEDMLRCAAMGAP